MNFKGKELEIKPLEKEDLKKAQAFMNFFNSLVAEGAMLAANEKIKNVSEQEKKIKKELERVEEGGLYLVSWDKDVVAGTVRVKRGEGRSKHVGVLTVAIKDGYRRLGMGKYFLNEAIERGRKLGIKIVRLSVLPENYPAIKLYEKFGFREVACIPSQIEYKGDFVSELVMIKKIQ